MKKKKGEANSRVLFDKKDLEILISLKEKPCGIMELKNRVGLIHPNLKRHTDKLKDADLIKSQPIPKSKKIILSVSHTNEIKTLLKILKRMDKKNKSKKHSNIFSKIFHKK